MLKQYKLNAMIYYFSSCDDVMFSRIFLASHSQIVNLSPEVVSYSGFPEIRNNFSGTAYCFQTIAYCFMETEICFLYKGVSYSWEPAVHQPS